jgi:23S rRNA (uracil1939-C5)-methyltransferase
VPSPHSLHYRNKADLVVSGTGSTFEIGFFARDSHHLIDIEACPIQQQSNNTLLQTVHEAVRRELVVPFDPQSGRGVLRRVVARTASNGEALLSVVTTREKWPQEQEFAAWMLEQVPNLVGVLRRQSKSAAQPVAGRDWLEEEVEGLKFRVRGEGFFQINSSLTPQLVTAALDALEVQNGDSVLDVFCGVGLFSLSAARQGASVLGIEANPQAVRDARGNAERNGLQAEFRAGDAARELKHLKSEVWHKVLIDPPREGAAECMPHLLRLQPERIVYVSCDPATLARDLKVLCAGNYRLESAVPLDMFPQTAHVETVAKLKRILS